MMCDCRWDFQSWGACGRNYIWKLIQSLWRTLWRFLKKLGIKLSYDPIVPLLGTLPVKIKIQTTQWKKWQTYFWGLQNHCRWWMQPLAPWKKSYDQHRQYIKRQRHYFANKGLSSQSYGFSCSHVWMWELDYKESWAPKNWCFWTLIEKSLESPLDCKEIQPVHPKGNQSWVFIGRTDIEAETPILWPPDAKNWSIGKDPDAGKDWR